MVAAARLRGALIAVVSLAVVAAGCFSGGRPSSAPAPTGEGARVDSAVPGDSVRGRDTLPGVQVTLAVPDSATDSAAVALGKPVAMDSAAKSAADSAAAAAKRDSVKKAAIKPKPKTRECVLDFNGSPPESRLVTNLLNDGSRTTFIGGGLVVQCQGDPQIIRADSAEQYESAQMMVLIGNVVFEEPGKIRMTAPSASYFTGEEKMVAYGGVVVTDLVSGSTFSGPTMEYYRAGSRRPFARLYAPQRPTARLVETDSTGAETTPTTVTANQMEDFGDTLLVAWGDVLINRDQMVGQGDSASFDKRSERMRLIRNAFIVSRDTTRAFRLSGDSIDLFSTDRVLERVTALHLARATSNDVSMRAERVEIQLDSQRVERAWAFGPGRAYAETSSQQLEADSIAIEMPDQVVRQLNAVGRAVAVATPDSLRIRNPERDVLAGDTIIADFDTATVAPDTTPRSQIRQITAILNASARYQLPSSRGPNCPPGINYVRGRRIVVDFDSGSVREVAVDSQASGLYLEAALDSLTDTLAVLCALRPDSLPQDSAAVDSSATPPPDTMVASAMHARSKAFAIRSQRVGSTVPSPVLYRQGDRATPFDRPRGADIVRTRAALVDWLHVPAAL